MIPALATIVFAYCVARLLLSFWEVDHEWRTLQNDTGSWAEAFHVLVVAVAIIAMAWGWWAIQQKGLEMADLSRSLGIGP